MLCVLLLLLCENNGKVGLRAIYSCPIPRLAMRRFSEIEPKYSVEAERVAGVEASEFRSN